MKMYGVVKALTPDSSPLIRLEKRLSSLRSTHNAALHRNILMEDKNLGVNRLLMENLMLRLHSVDSKSKKNKRVANRIKLSSPKKIRVNKTHDVYASNCPVLSDFQQKPHGMKRSYQDDGSNQHDLNILKEMRELPSFHSAEIETLLAKKEGFGFEKQSSRNDLQKVEPIFPPPPDVIQTASPHFSPAPGCSVSLGSRGTSKMMRRASPSRMALIGAVDKFSPTTGYPRHTGSYHSQFNRQATLPQVAPNSSDSYSYQAFCSRYGQNYYSELNVNNENFSGQGFGSEYGGFNPYSRPPEYSSWTSQSKYTGVQCTSNRSIQNANPSSSVPESSCNFRDYSNVNTDSQDFSYSLSFPPSFTSDNFMQNVPPYHAPLDLNSTSYDMSFPSYGYSQVPLTSAPPVTTSYQ